MKERIFSSIQNQETAYWLGFLAADGSIFENKLVIGLSAKDTEHLEKFKVFQRLIIRLQHDRILVIMEKPMELLT